MRPARGARFGCAQTPDPQELWHKKCTLLEAAEFVLLHQKQRTRGVFKPARNNREEMRRERDWIGKNLEARLAPKAGRVGRGKHSAPGAAAPAPGPVLPRVPREAAGHPLPSRALGCSMNNIISRRTGLPVIQIGFMSACGVPGSGTRP